MVTGRTTQLRGPHAASGRRVGDPCFRVLHFNQFTPQSYTKKVSIYNKVAYLFIRNIAK